MPLSIWLAQAASAADSAAELLPPSTLVYLEISDPPGMIDSFLNHSYTANLKQLEPYQQFEQSPKFLQAMTILRVVEFQLGTTWREAIKTMSSGGLTIAFDPATEGFVMLFHASDAKRLASLRDKVVTMARKDAERKGNEDPYRMEKYRDVDVYVTKDGGFLTYENWLVVGNQSELGKSIVDSLIDGRDDSFAQNLNFQKVRSQLKIDSVAWGFVNLEPLRQSEEEGLQKLFAGQADDPAGEILLGGVLEAFKTAEYFAASVVAQPNGLNLNLRMPFRNSEISELREHYWGPQGAGQPAVIPVVPNMLFGLTAYRNLAQMWLRAGDLFNEKVNDGIAQADSNLSTFFSGKDFAEDILGALSPQIQIVAARQKYQNDRPTPAIKVPAFALVTEMKDPQTTTREFRRIFQSFIGFFNVVGAMEGNPQFELDYEKFENGELISATPLPLLGEENEQQAKITYNFSPTIAFKDEQLVISSATQLASAIVNSKAAPATVAADVNTQMRLSGPELQKTLVDNRSHLISQNVLKEGHTREEAEQQIAILLEVLKLFDHASVELLKDDSNLHLNLGVELKE